MKPANAGFFITLKYEKTSFFYNKKMCKKSKIKTCVKPCYACLNTRFYFHKKHHFFYTFNSQKTSHFCICFYVVKTIKKC